MDRIVKDDGNLDVELFDKVVEATLDAKNPKKNEAEKILSEFLDNPNSWTKVDSIIRQSKSSQSKFIGLKVLEDNIKVRWNLLDDNTKEAIRNYVISYIMANSTTSSTDIVLKRFNSILIDIVKKEWPKKFPNFINDLISASESSSMIVCSNALVILKQVNEDVFMLTEDVTTAKKGILRKALHYEYPQIFAFIQKILEYSRTQEVEGALLKNSFFCFESYCNHLSAEYIFSTSLIDIIMFHLDSSHSIEVLSSIYKITRLFEVNTESEDGNIDIPNNIDPERFFNQINFINNGLLSFWKKYLGKFESEREFSSLYKNFEENEKSFVKLMGKCLASIFRNFFPQIPEDDLKRGLTYLRNISNVDDLDLFQQLFSTWKVIIKKFYSEYPVLPATNRGLNRTKYDFILVAMIPVFVKFMPKPDEVFIAVNELGEVVRDKTMKTSEIEFYESMRDNFYCMAFCIDSEIRNYFIKEVDKFKNVGHNWDKTEINKVCWSFGCLAGVFSKKDERLIYIDVLKSLLTLCEIKTTKEDKAVVASNIIFLTGQFQRFMKDNFDFFSVILVKIIEFSVENHEGVKEMAANSFFKICEWANPFIVFF